MSSVWTVHAPDELLQFRYTWTPRPSDPLPLLMHLFHTCGPSFLTWSAGLSPRAALSSALAPATISKVMMMAPPALSLSVSEAQYKHVPSKMELWVLEDPADVTAGVTVEAAIIKHMDEANTLYQLDRATQKPCRQVAHGSLAAYVTGGRAGRPTRLSPHLRTLFELGCNHGFYTRPCANFAGCRS